MEVLANTIVEINNMLYTLNLPNIICQLYLTKISEKKKKIEKKNLEK